MSERLRVVEVWPDLHGNDVVAYRGSGDLRKELFRGDFADLDGWKDAQTGDYVLAMSEGAYRHLRRYADPVSIQ